MASIGSSLSGGTVVTGTTGTARSASALPDSSEPDLAADVAADLAFDVAADTSAPFSRRAQRDIDHIRALYVQSPASLTGNGIGMLLMVAVFWPLAEPARLIAWVGVVAVLWGLRLLHWLRFRYKPDADDATLLAWRRSWKALVLLQGAAWGLAVWLFWGLGTDYHRLALILIPYSYCLGSVQLLATQRVTFIAFISLVLVPTIARIATDTSQPWNWQLAGILTLLFGLSSYTL